MLDAVDRAWGKVLEAFALCACVLIGLMALMICADVLLRNVALIPGVDGIAWSNELSETGLYLITMLAAPWLLRRGQHIRVDILLRAIPKRLAWYFEWACDCLALGCCGLLMVYGAQSALASKAAGALSIKTLVTPEWWLLAPLPVAFLLLGIEVLFRMRRLYLAERAPREDAVSAS